MGTTVTRERLIADELGHADEDERVQEERSVGGVLSCSDVSFRDKYFSAGKARALAGTRGETLSHTLPRYAKLSEQPMRLGEPPRTSRSIFLLDD